MKKRTFACIFRHPHDARFGDRKPVFPSVGDILPRTSRSCNLATVNAAKLLDVSDEVGTIASSKSADVIAVDSSPLDDVSALQRMAFVMARGDVYLGVT